MASEDVFIFKPCKTGAAFQGTLRKNEKLDLNKAEQRLRDAGYGIVLNTRNVLIIKSKYDISVFPSGRILVKGITDEKEACKQIEKVYGVLGLD